MITYSPFPADPRPRRTIEALLREGMAVDLICLKDGNEPRHEKIDQLNILRLPISHRRGGVVSYAYQYSAFISASACIVGFRSLKRSYDLVYVHNMPDVLVASAILPKMRGAKVILDMHDPMPELMSTIFGFGSETIPIGVLRLLEKWSMARADSVVTVNLACKNIFASRSCTANKITVVMNSPDETIFPLRSANGRKFSERSSQRFVVMYHGSIVERNGLDLAMGAIERVREFIPNVELRIYGRSTPFLERVLNEVQVKGLHEHVVYKGPKRLEELVDEIGQCDVGVIPNQRNAFTDINTPTRLFEYLTLSKPVIAPQTDGITDYFDANSLFFFRSGDAHDLARAIKVVHDHPAETQAIVERGQQVYLGHKWSEESQTLLNVIHGLLKVSH